MAVAAQHELRAARQVVDHVRLVPEHDRRVHGVALAERRIGVCVAFSCGIDPYPVHPSDHRRLVAQQLDADLFKEVSKAVRVAAEVVVVPEHGDTRNPALTHGCERLADHVHDARLPVGDGIAGECDDVRGMTEDELERLLGQADRLAVADVAVGDEADEVAVLVSGPAR